MLPADEPISPQDTLPKQNEDEAFQWNNRRPTTRLKLVEKQSVMDLLEPAAATEEPRIEEYGSKLTEDDLRLVDQSSVSENVKEDAEPDHVPETLGFNASDRKLLERLSKTTPTTRAIHAYIMQLLTDPATQIGKSLRRNLVRSLALTIANKNIMPSADVALVPQQVIDELELSSPAAAIVYIAMHLTRTVNPTITDYVNSIAVAFDSFTKLDEEKAHARMFAVTESLSSKLRTWQKDLIA